MSSAWNSLDDLSALKALRERLWERRAAVFVGAGFSRSAKTTVPSASKPPLWSDLEEALREKLYPQNSEQAPSDVLRLAQEFKHVHSRDELHEVIADQVADSQLSPSPNHIDLLRLPWADVFTTNYDTLLEKAAKKCGRRYSNVYNPSDLARARPPRIVKLHGSLPNRFPLVITEEDYRTYPQRRAPFVALARSSLAENALVLIGFSGDDPNFLSWTGWIRDHLGEDAPPIYFVTLDLPVQKRTLLEDRGIAPIDLSPIAPREKDWLSVDDRYEEAYRWLFAVFEDARPPDPLEWPLSSRKRSSRSTRARSPSADPLPSPNLQSRKSRRFPPYKRTPQNLSEDGLPDNDFFVEEYEAWAEERERYPGWVVPPKQVRGRLWKRTREWNQDVLDQLSSLEAPHDLKLIYELVWRLEKALLFISKGRELNRLLGTLLRYNPFPSRINLEEMCGLVNFSNADSSEQEPDGETSYNGGSFVTPKTHPNLPWSDLRSVWVESALAVLQSLRENGQDQLFDTLQDSLSPVVVDQARWAAMHTLERATHRLDNLDYPAARQILTNWTDAEGEYPYGGIQRASLLAEAGATEEAAQIASATLDQILGAQAQISHPSLRLKSEEQWVRHLLDHFQRVNKYQRDEDDLDVQPESLQDPKGLGGDPADRLEKVKGKLSGTPPYPSSGKEVTPNFDLGSYETSYSAGGPSVDDFRPAFAYLRMSEKGGTPIRVANIVFGREDTTNASNWIRPLKPGWSWSILARLASEESFDTVLTRRRISALSEEHAQTLFGKAHRGVTTSTEDLESGSHESRVAKGRLKGLIDFLSRLSIRRDVDAERSLELAIRLSKHSELHSADSRVIYGKLEELLERSISPLPDSVVREHLDDIYSMPLVGRDLPSRGTMGQWFEPTDSLPQLDLQPGDVGREKIARLISVLNDKSRIPPDTDPEEERSVARSFASVRLHYLYRCGGLSEKQTEEFASAYWKQADNADSIPDLMGITSDFSLNVPPLQGDSRSERVRNALLPDENLAVGDEGFSVPTKATTFIQAIRRASIPTSGQVPERTEHIHWGPDDAKKLVELLSQIWDSDGDRYEEERRKEEKRGAFLVSPADAIEQHLRLIPLALRDAVLPTLPQDQASGVRRVISEMEEVGFATAVVYPDLLKLDAVTPEEARGQIQRHLATSENWNIELGARAIERWTRLWDETELSEKPERLIRDLVNSIATRRRPGLTVSLKVMSDILEDAPSVIGPEQVSELATALVSLREETAPPSEAEAWRMPEIEEGRVRSREDRAAAVSLASALRDWYNQREDLEESGEIEVWKDIAENSPMPEVHEAWHENEK